MDVFTGGVGYGCSLLTLLQQGDADLPIADTVADDTRVFER